MMETNSRRTFLTRATSAVLGMGAAVAAWPALRSLIPNVLYEPPKRFKLGPPDGFQQGVTFLDEHRIYLFRDGDRFHAISGICSHLGCTVKFSPTTLGSEKTVRSQPSPRWASSTAPAMAPSSTARARTTRGRRPGRSSGIP